MASPFYYFRKHQKVFLAVAAVLAMVVFVFADLLTSAISTRGRDPRQSLTVARWDGGSMSGQELGSLVRRRLFISRFLLEIAQTGARRLMENGGTPLEPSVPNFIVPRNTPLAQIHSDCISTRVLSQLAEAAGMFVADDQINNYLRQMSFGQLSGTEIANLLREGNSASGRQAEAMLFGGLQEMLLANSFLASYSSTLECVTPEQRWQDWRRVNERIAVEAAILPASQFLPQTDSPTEMQLTEFYEEFKDNVAGQKQLVVGRPLPSPTPGFREPRRVQLQYLLADVAAHTQKLLDSITAEEIEDYYQRNKRSMFVQQESSETAETSPDTLTMDEMSQDEADEEETDEEETDETGADDETSADSDLNQPAAGDPEGDDQPAQQDPQGDEQPEASGEPAAALESGANPFRLVALADEDDEEAAQDGEAAAEAPEDAVELEDEAELAFVPLAEVRDSILRNLAREKAVVQLEALVDKANAQLDREYQPYGLRVAESQESQQAPPAPPENLADLGALARETGLLHEQTVLLSQPALADTFVGKATDAQNQRLSVVQAAFSNLALYEPFRARDLDGNWYLVVKIEDVPTRVPPLEEIRDQVTEAWKEREAARLALETAEELATAAAASGKTLDLFLENQPYEVVTTDLFSWLTFGAIPLEYQPRPPQLGEAPPLIAVGVDFMTKVFALQPDTVASVLNHDQTQAFVLRLASREQSLDQLRQQFLADDNNSAAGYVMSQLRFRTAQQALTEQLRQQVHLDIEGLEEYAGRTQRR